jgi:hypothetical protein
MRKVTMRSTRDKFIVAGLCRTFNYLAGVGTFEVQEGAKQSVAKRPLAQ